MSFNPSIEAYDHNKVYAQAGTNIFSICPSESDLLKQAESDKWHVWNLYFNTKTFHGGVGKTFPWFNGAVTNVAPWFYSIPLCVWEIYYKTPKLGIELPDNYICDDKLTKYPINGRHTDGKWYRHIGGGTVPTWHANAYPFIYTVWSKDKNFLPRFDALSTIKADAVYNNTQNYGLINNMILTKNFSGNSATNVLVSIYQGQIDTVGSTEQNLVTATDSRFVPYRISSSYAVYSATKSAIPTLLPPVGTKAYNGISVTVQPNDGQTVTDYSMVVDCNYYPGSRLDINLRDRVLNQTLSTSGSQELTGVSYSDGHYLMTTTYGEAIIKSEADLEKMQQYIVRPKIGDIGSIANIKYLNNVFLACGISGDGDGIIMYSKDGKTWNFAAINSHSQIEDVTFGNGVYVAVGYHHGEVFYSYDAISWVLAKVDRKNIYNHSVMFANNTFLIGGGNSGDILISKDGIHWKQTDRMLIIPGGNETPRYGDIFNICYANNLFAAVGFLYSEGFILTSPDGNKWTRSFIDKTNRGIARMTCGDNTFVAIGNGIVVRSTDGITWTSTTVDFDASTLNFINNAFVSFGSSKTVSSPDGITWTQIQHGAGLAYFEYKDSLYYGIDYNGPWLIYSQYITATPTIAKSPTTSERHGKYTLKFTAFLNNVLMLCGTYFNTFRTTAPTGLTGAILSSVDGTTWAERTIGLNKDILGMTYGMNLYVAVGLGGIIYTSPNGITWTKQTSVVVDDLYSITYANNLFVAVGEYNTITTSPNGITWTKQTTEIVPDNLYSITYGNNLYVAVGEYCAILTSPDGITWTNRVGGVSAETLYSISYGNNLFVITCSGSSILTSPNGITWTKRTIGSTGNLLSVTYGKNQFVVVGYNSTILTSTDGEIWVPRSCGAMYVRIFSVTYGNDQFVALGDEHIILNSPDAITWTLRNQSLTLSQLLDYSNYKDITMLYSYEFLAPLQLPYTTESTYSANSIDIPNVPLDDLVYIKDYNMYVGMRIFDYSSQCQLLSTIKGVPPWRQYEAFIPYTTTLLGRNTVKLYTCVIDGVTQVLLVNTHSSIFYSIRLDNVFNKITIIQQNLRSSYIDLFYYGGNLYVINSNGTTYQICELEKSWISADEETHLNVVSTIDTKIPIGTSDETAVTSVTVLHNEILYILVKRNASSTLYGFNLLTHNIVGSLPVGAYAFGFRPYIANGRIFFPYENGYYCTGTAIESPLKQNGEEYRVLETMDNRCAYPEDHLDSGMRYRPDTVSDKRHGVFYATKVGRLDTTNHLTGERRTRPAEINPLSESQVYTQYDSVNPPKVTE